MDTTMKPYHCPFCPHGWTAPNEEHIDATACPQCGGEAFVGPFDTDAKINAIEAHVCIRKIWRANAGYAYLLRRKTPGRIIVSGSWVEHIAARRAS